MDDEDPTSGSACAAAAPSRAIGASRRTLLARAAGLSMLCPLRAVAQPPPIVAAQPAFASVKRALEALAAIGQPLGQEDQEKIGALRAVGDSTAMVAAEAILDRYTIARVTLGRDGAGLAMAGGAARRLSEQGWTAFLVRVENPFAIMEALSVTGGATTVSSPSTAAARTFVEDTINVGPSIAETWFRNEIYRLPPIGATLSGAPLEYQIVQIFSRDHGAREMELGFFASTDSLTRFRTVYYHRGVRLQFNCVPSHDVRFHVRDSDGRSCMASFVITDRNQHVFPFQPMRLAPDMYFHPQIYRADGETVRLPPGVYTIEVRRGPEYLVRAQPLTVGDGGGEVAVQLERWIDPSHWGWYSGDTHVHAGGCAHYEHPTEGVAPETMIRHVRGEGLSIADVLSWGPSWYHQKGFFTGNAISPPADLESPALQAADNASLRPAPSQEDAESTLRYDVEVSAFPSGFCGHLVLLRLKEQDYPGASLIEDWPSWNLPILRWAKSQGGLAGYAHCGYGMEVNSTELPNYEIPPMNSIGTQEAIVDVTHGFVDFLSGADSNPVAELNAWYHLLNCGYRLAMLGETDYPCISGERPGVGRSYVRLDERPVGNDGYEAWMRNLALGRLYFGDGRSHFLDWTVEKCRAGEGDLRLEGRQTVQVTALIAARLDARRNEHAVRPSPYPMPPEERMWSLEKARIGDTRDVLVELIVNGHAVAAQRLHADGGPQLLTFFAPLSRSSWIALRILPSAHTYPIFVEVAGRPIRASRRSAEWCRQCVDKLWDVKSPMIRDTERPAAAEAYGHARQAYDRIIAESDLA